MDSIKPFSNLTGSQKPMDLTLFESLNMMAWLKLIFLSRSSSNYSKTYAGSDELPGAFPETAFTDCLAPYFFDELEDYLLSWNELFLSLYQWS